MASLAAPAVAWRTPRSPGLWPRRRLRSRWTFAIAELADLPVVLRFTAPPRLAFAFRLASASSFLDDPATLLLRGVPNGPKAGLHVRIGVRVLLPQTGRADPRNSALRARPAASLSLFWRCSRQRPAEPACSAHLAGLDRMRMFVSIGSFSWLARLMEASRTVTCDCSACMDACSSPSGPAAVRCSPSGSAASLFSSGVQIFLRLHRPRPS